MSRAREKIVILAAALFAGGCAEVSYERMVPSSGVGAATTTERLVAVLPVRGGTNANKLAFDPIDQVRIDDGTFHAALAEAVVGSGLFRKVVAQGEALWELQGEIVFQQALRAGFLAVTATLVVSYRLVDAGTRSDAWRGTIITHDTAVGTPFTEGLAGATRKALEGAARENLSQMVDQVHHVLR